MKDHQNHPQNEPQGHQNRLQGLQNLTNKQPPQALGAFKRTHKPFPNHSPRHPQIILWDNYKGSPMLELWTARTRNLGEPQVPD